GYWARHLCEPVRLTDGFRTLLGSPAVCRLPAPPAVGDLPAPSAGDLPILPVGGLPAQSVVGLPAPAVGGLPVPPAGGGLPGAATLIVELGPGESMVRFARRSGASDVVSMLGRDGPLAALAVLWERGVDVGWEGVLGGSGRRCALPPHPLEPRPCSRPVPTRP